MPKKPLLSAALATGVVVSGAQADLPGDTNPSAGDSPDIIGTALSGPVGGDRFSGNLIITLDEEIDGADLVHGLPDTVHAGDDWDIGIDYAQTLYGGGDARDGISSGRTGRGNITLDNGIKRNGNITLDNGLKGQGKVRVGKPQAGNRIGRPRKQRTRK